MVRPKRILIIAGPNGAGKTTFATELLPNEADCPLFVNADLIAAGLSPFAPEVAAVKAGRLMLQRILDLAASGESFAFETTLSGLIYSRRIPRWSDGLLCCFDLSVTSVARVGNRPRCGARPSRRPHRARSDDS